jgi:hypothetical protein
MSDRQQTNVHAQRFVTVPNLQDDYVALFSSLAQRRSNNQHIHDIIVLLTVKLHPFLQTIEVVS